MGVLVGSVKDDTLEEPYPGVKNLDVFGHSPYRLRRLYPDRPASSIEGPQVFLVDTAIPDFSFRPHFHDVDQFQIFLRGNGSFGKHPIKGIAAHYASAYTPYGPIVTGSEGLAYMTVRAKVDSGSKFMPGSGHLRKRKTNRATIIDLDTEHPESKVLDGPDPDELCVARSVLAPGASLRFFAPEKSGGQVGVVLSGSLAVDGGSFPRWSCLYAAPGEGSAGILAGADGADVLVMTFPTPVAD